MLSSRDQDSWAWSVIVLDGFDNPVLLEDNLAERLGLAVAKFEHDFSAGVEEGASLGGEAAEKVQTVGAAIERRERVVGADFGLERFDFRGGDVGRVADDEVQPRARRQGGKAIALRELYAVGEAMARGVLPGHFEGRGRDVGGIDLRGGDVGRVADEEVQPRARRQGGKAIALRELYAVGN